MAIDIEQFEQGTVGDGTTTSEEILRLLKTNDDEERAEWVENTADPEAFEATDDGERRR